MRLVWVGGHKLEDEHPVEGAAARAEVRGQPTENKVGTVKEEKKTSAKRRTLQFDRPQKSLRNPALLTGSDN